LEVGGGEWIRREVVAMVHYGRKKVSGGLLGNGWKWKGCVMRMTMMRN